MSIKYIFNVFTGNFDAINSTLSGGVSILYTTSTIDDNNTTFVFNQIPTLLVINGLLYRQNGGSITWTVSGNSVVLSEAVGLDGTIFGIFGGIISEFSGTINDSNTSFTTYIQPIYAIVNGAAYTMTCNYPWTYTTGSVGLDDSVGVNGSVFGLSGLSLLVDENGVISGLN